MVKCVLESRVSDSLKWELTKNYNHHLVSNEGRRFTKNPLSLTNQHTYKYSPELNSKFGFVKTCGENVCFVMKSYFEPEKQLKMSFEELKNKKEAIEKIKKCHFRRDLAEVVYKRMVALKGKTIRVNNKVVA